MNVNRVPWSDSYRSLKIIQKAASTPFDVGRWRDGACIRIRHFIVMATRTGSPKQRERAQRARSSFPSAEFFQKLAESRNHALEAQRIIEGLEPTIRDIARQHGISYGDDAS